MCTEKLVAVAESIKNNVLQSIIFPMGFVVFMWIIHILKFATGWPGGRLGLYPRDTSGLKGILTAPLIHGDWAHLISNSLPMIALGLIIFVFYKKVAFKSFFLIYFLTGLAVWIFGRSVYHIGASGVVYGMVSFVFWSGIFRRNIKSIVLALIITFLYSGLFLGILPNQPGISWESHLLGAIVGIFVAWFFKNDIEKDEEPVQYQLEDSGTDYFLNRDTFDQTLAERQRAHREGY